MVQQKLCTLQINTTDTYGGDDMSQARKLGPGKGNGNDTLATPREGTPRYH